MLSRIYQTFISNKKHRLLSNFNKRGGRHVEHCHKFARCVPLFSTSVPKGPTNGNNNPGGL